MKQTLHLNACNHPGIPSRTIELETERILCNDVHLPLDRGSNPHKVRLWVIGNEYGALGAVWADCEQDALDELCDSGLSAGLAIEEADADEETSRLGNAGEPHDLTYAWMQTVNLDPKLDGNVSLLCSLAEARGQQAENLSDV